MTVMDSGRPMSLAQARKLLEEIYTPAHCRMWWNSPNWNLRGRVPLVTWFTDLDGPAQVCNQIQRLANGGA